ncbi:bursicon-like [Limulus polyphemus]|uniref:Bursicon-like n=1 Tax=Limulus polyphemus TaxID=6850 RepID=A0ABM1TAR6_LIMPO|nr:bursicon-like [Limulus polyphemus]
MQTSGPFWRVSDNNNRNMSSAGNVRFMRCVIWILVAVTVVSKADKCQLRPVVHMLQIPECGRKAIPSFACQGTCSSYVQVSGSKFWQIERSCMCCQEMGEREAIVNIFCQHSTNLRLRKVITRAPADCMCRPCTAVDEESIHPQEVAERQTKEFA